MSNVTRLIKSANRGDRHAAAETFPLVYDELRKLSAARTAAEAPVHTSTPPPWSTKQLAEGKRVGQ